MDSEMCKVEEEGKCLERRGREEDGRRRKEEEEDGKWIKKYI